jgi:hypothetical protein
MSRATSINGFALLAALVAAASFTFAEPAAAKTKTQRAGNIEVQVSYDQPEQYRFRNVRIKITRAGQVLRDEPGPCGAGADDCADYPPWPVVQGSHNPIRIISLDTDPEREIIIEFFTGGAHCCSLSPIYDFDPATNTYKRRVVDWADAGFRLKDLGTDGRIEFVSSDARFAYEFASFAGSAFPIQIRRFRNGRLVDVTRRFRSEIARDARRHRRDYLRARRNPEYELRGLLAAYVADKYLLGQRASAIRYLRRAKDRGDLGKGGEAYISKLRRFLKARGY